MIDYGLGVHFIKLSDADIENTFRWRNDKRIYAWCRQFEPLDFDNHKKWHASLPQRNDVKMFSIISKDSVAPIGVCGLTSIDYINGHAEFSLYLSPFSHGFGYGKASLKTLVMYGFNVLRLNHIFGESFDGNPAIKMFESVGFKKDGIRRSFYYREGKYVDAHIMSILPGELI